MWEIKDSGLIFTMKKSHIKSALRTLTAVSKFNVDEIDFVISQEPPQFDKILQLSKWKGKFDWFKHNQNIKSKSKWGGGRKKI